MQPEDNHSPDQPEENPHYSLMSLFDHHLPFAPAGPPIQRTLPTHGGVYLITDQDHRPILLAMGENLRRVVAGRLAAGPPEQKSKRADLAQVAAHLYWRETFSRFETALEHWRAARLLNPKGYRKTIAISPAWFLRVDLQARTPQFTPWREFAADRAHHTGPFATRSDAEEWAGLLEALFDLCRYHQVLEQAPHGWPCAYFDMGKCPAPCDGTVTLEEYRPTVVGAAAFSAGDHRPRLAALRQSMQAAANAQAFERAAAIRQTIDRAKAMVARPQYRHLTELSSCCWLIVQRGGPARRGSKNVRLRPFFVRRGAIEIGEPTGLADIEEAIPHWIARCGACSVLPPASSAEQTARCEALWLVSKFLFQGERAPGLFFRFDQLPDAPTLAAAIRHQFGPREA